MKRKPEAGGKALRELARLHGVQTSYVDIDKKRQTATPESLLAVLAALGAPVDGMESVEEALRVARRDRCRRALEPVYVTRGQRAAHVDITLPTVQLGRSAELRLRLENGEAIEQPIEPDKLPAVKAEVVDGTHFTTFRCPLPTVETGGYHRIAFESGTYADSALLIAAPRRCYKADTGTDCRWGTFLPLYALRSRDDWGLGDFTGLHRLVSWTHELGGDLVGSLPLLAAFLDDPCDFSPYSPVSRRFWNEVFLDVTRAPEWPRSERAQAIAGSSEHRAERQRLHEADLVEYRRVIKFKRACLEELARVALRENGRFRAFLAGDGELRRYALFRAACERFGVPWWGWPERARQGRIDEADVDPDVVTYHAYVQWLAEEQLSTAAEDVPGHAAIYMDFPLGVHPAGFDTWQDRQVFVQNLSMGAPPDPFFSKGQTWGLPPLHPETLRTSGYRYLRESMVHNLKYAEVLRIDHVMSFHRLFCVPEGAEAVDGVYVRYPADEIYAMLALESHRAETEIVGEDLGTVPQEVRTTMKRNGLNRMYVLQFSFQDDPGQPVAESPVNALASLNTHDTPTFAGFYTGSDIEDRLALDLLSEEEAASEREEREVLRKRLRTFLAAHHPPERAWNDTYAAVRGLLGFLSRSAADIVLVNIEDLWLETSPQNVPGTTTEVPNWRRKARLSLEEFAANEEVLDTLREVNHLRKASRTR